MKRILIILTFFIISCSINGQTEQVTGSISYKSSQHTYVRFKNTRGIQKGDTLYVREGSALKPALVVQAVSSASCLCIPVNGEYPEGHIIIANARRDEQKSEIVLQEKQQEQPDETTAVVESDRAAGTQTFAGSISAASYSGVSGEGNRNQRFRYRLSADASSISGSKFSARSYVSYSNNTRKIFEGDKFRNDGLRVYDLWLKYDLDSSFFLKLGRQINNRMISTGPFDGITAEKSFKGISAGITGGTAPDYDNYGFNSKLLQFGGYAGYDFAGRSSSSSTSLAFVQQTASGRTDRRYLYFQQSAFIGRKIILFGSAEADLYDPGGKSIKFTSGYFNLNWRSTQRLSINATYDARRNPVFHETYRTSLDSLIENELRQTLRFGADLRIRGNMNAGLRSSIRILPSDSRESMNLSGYFTWRSQGRSMLSATLSGNYLQTSIMDGYYSSLTLRKNSGKVQAGAGYSYYSFALGENTGRTFRHTARADITIRFTQKTFLVADYELALEQLLNSHFIFLQLTQRF